MKITIGKYTSWFGPYQIAEKILFWKDKHDDDIVDKFGQWLADDSNGNDTLLTKLCYWIDSKKKRKIKIHIDKWDTWNMDTTLAYIIVPMLKQLKETKHGAPHVDDKDVPKELRSTRSPRKKNNYDVDNNHFKRWDWVIDEMIWAFEQKITDDWEQQYYSGQSDHWLQPVDKNNKPVGNPFPFSNRKKGKEDGVVGFKMIKGPNDTFKIDRKGLEAHQKRIDNGFRLFGKYYSGLWD